MPKNKSGKRMIQKRKILWQQKERLKTVLFPNNPYIFYGEKVALLENEPNTQELPSFVKLFLQEFENLFAEELPSGLPPLRGFEHPMPGATKFISFHSWRTLLSKVGTKLQYSTSCHPKQMAKLR